MCIPLWHRLERQKMQSKGYPIKKVGGWGGVGPECFYLPPPHDTFQLIWAFNPPWPYFNSSHDTHVLWGIVLHPMRGLKVLFVPGFNGISPNRIFITFILKDLSHNSCNLQSLIFAIPKLSTLLTLWQPWSNSKTNSTCPMPCFKLTIIIQIRSCLSITRSPINTLSLHTW